MKLHFDGTTKYLGAGTVGWAQFSCLFSYDEVTILEAYLCSKLIAYHLTPCFRVVGRVHIYDGPHVSTVPCPSYDGDRHWYLNMPENDAMEFRLRFPCSHVPTEDLRKGVRMKFDEHTLDFDL